MRVKNTILLISLLFLLAFCGYGCGFVVGATTVELANGKELTIYQIEDRDAGLLKLYFEWDGKKHALALPIHSELIGINAGEDGKLFLLYQPSLMTYSTADKIDVAVLLDDNFIRISPVDFPRELLTNNLSPFASKKHRQQYPDLQYWDFFLADYDEFGFDHYFFLYCPGESNTWRTRYQENINSIELANGLSLKFTPAWVKSTACKTIADWEEVIPCKESHFFNLMATDFVSEAEKMIQNGVDLNFTSPGGRTPLMNAALHDNHRMINLLLDYGANLEIENNNGETAIFYAIYGKSFDALELLFLEDSDIYHTNKYGENIAMIAAMAAPRMVSWLLGYEAYAGSKHFKLVRLSPSFPEKNIYYVENRDWSRRRDFRWVKQTNHIGESLLHYLTMSGTKGCAHQFDAVSRIARRALKDDHSSDEFDKLYGQANINQQNKFGETPLHYLIRTCILDPDPYNVTRYEAMLKILLKAGADLNIPNKAGDTPRDMMLSARPTCHSEMFKKLLAEYSVSK